jgi:hypothetical protein
MKLFKATKPTDVISSSSEGYKTFHAIEGTLLMLNEAPNKDFEEVLDAEAPPIEGILRFDLNDPYALESFLNASKANSLKGDIDTYYDKVIRPIYRYDNFNGKKLTKGQKEIIEHLMKGLNEHFNPEN